jgi:transcriptional regulator with XRE-family HTH domain
MYRKTEHVRGGLKLTAADKINQYLEGHGITKAFLSRKSGIKISTLNEKLKGRTRINSDDISKICKALGREPNDFIVIPEGSNDETIS